MVCISRSEHIHLGNPSGKTWEVQSCRSDHFKLLPWPNTSGIRLLSGLMQVGLLPAAPLPGGVKVARRPVKPFGVGASPTLAANLWKAGRYKLAAPVSKTGSGKTEVGALPTPSAMRPVAQKDSPRLISGRPRSITVRDDHCPG